MNCYRTKTSLYYTETNQNAMITVLYTSIFLLTGPSCRSETVLKARFDRLTPLYYTNTNQNAVVIVLYDRSYTIS